MRIGYPCINRSIGCTANSTFRLASYSEANLIEKVGNNLRCLLEILEYNRRAGLLFFRISSDLVPFASHPVCTFDWQSHFADRLREIGRFAETHGMRLSMHPDQFVLINSPKADVVKRSIRELEYHADVLDGMGLDATARIQIHVGGLYGDRAGAIARFSAEFEQLPEKVRRRLAVENDDRLFSLADCLEVSRQTGVPIVFDFFHHAVLNGGEPIRAAVEAASRTWQPEDGPLMTDYSSQAAGQRAGRHTEHIDLDDFGRILEATRRLDYDIMLEIKDKEASALEAVEALRRFQTNERNSHG